MTHLPHVRWNENFPQNMGSITFMCLLNANLMQKKKKTEKCNKPILREHCYRRTYGLT